MKLFDDIITNIKSFLGKAEVKKILKEALLLLISGVVDIAIKERANNPEWL